MFLLLFKKSKYILGLVAFLLLSFQSAWASGPSESSVFSNPLAVLLTAVMILLLFVIGVFANILIVTAEAKRKKRKRANSVAITSILLFFFMLSGSFVFAEEINTGITKQAIATIGGITASVFYLVAAIIVLELVIIIAMLFNIKSLLKPENGELPVISDPSATEAINVRLNWLQRMNIPKLKNQFSPQWQYSFYLLILVTGICIWRYQVLHEGPSIEQTDTSISGANTNESSASKNDAGAENTATLLTSTGDLPEGKAIFMKSCAACHQESGAGNVGPNLTDDFWMHGNHIDSLIKTIRNGINAMPPWQNTYSDKQIAQMASYIKSLNGTNPPNAKDPQGIKMKEVDRSSKSTTKSIKTTEGKIAMNQKQL